MNREKASEYFELIRGRKPTEAELDELLSKEKANVSFEPTDSMRAQKTKINKITGIFQIILLASLVIAMLGWGFVEIGYFPMGMMLLFIDVLSFVTLALDILSLHRSKRNGLSRVGHVWSISSVLLIVFLTSSFVIFNWNRIITQSPIDALVLLFAYLFIVPMLCIGAVLILLQHPVRYEISNKSARKLKTLSAISLVAFIVVNINLIINMMKFTANPIFSSNLVHKVLIIFVMVTIAAVLIFWLVKINRYHPMFYVVLNIILLFTFVGISIFSMTVRGNYQDSLDKVHEINREINEDTKIETLDFDAQYKQTVDDDHDATEKANKYGNMIGDRQQKRVEGKSYQCNPGFTLSDFGERGHLIQYKQSDFNDTLNQDCLTKLNKKMSNFNSYAFAVDLFTEKLEKFGTTGDEQPLKNFFDLNTALKVINSENYTGQITTSELETDGFLN